MLHKVTVLKVMGARGAERAWLACCLRLWDFVHLNANLHLCMALLGLNA